MFTIFKKFPMNFLEPLNSFFFVLVKEEENATLFFNGCEYCNQELEFY